MQLDDGCPFLLQLKHVLSFQYFFIKSYGTLAFATSATSTTLLSE
jgi:hypothetical protein